MATQPPVEFLLTCSQMSLQDFELSRLALVSKLRKQLRATEEQVFLAQAEAIFARWLLEYREDITELRSIGALQGRLLNM